MEIKFFDSDDKYGVIKATIHKTGKLGFSSGAIKKLDIQNNRLFKIGRNSADPDDNCLYLVAVSDEDEQTYRATKAGDYYYIRINNILSEIGIDYKKEAPIIFDIQEVNESGQLYYKLIRRK
jgi:hypothetical protein